MFLQLVFIICSLIKQDRRQDILRVYPSMCLYTHVHTLCIPKTQNLVKETTWYGLSHI